jgi:hypothetical protein
VPDSFRSLGLVLIAAALVAPGAQPFTPADASPGVPTAMPMPTFLPPASTAAPTADPLAAADAEFAAGRLDEAYAGYRSAAAANADSVAAMSDAGRSALFANDLAACRRYLLSALDLPGAKAGVIQSWLDEADHRAAAAADPDAAKLPAAGIAIPMVDAEPLPLFTATVNGKTGYFMLDTGAPNIVIDPDFAKELGLTLSSGGIGHFAGGRTATVAVTQIQSFSIGGTTLHDQAATVLPTRGIPFFGIKRVDGILGTIFLSHYLATIDYPEKRLVLRPRSASSAWESGVPASATSVPFWYVPDHYLFARGSINGERDVMMLVDSGLAGGGFMPAPSTVTTARIALQDDKAGTGMGGGGSVTVVPFVADRLCLGAACQDSVRGLYTPGGSPFAIFPFAVAGGISHMFLEHYAVTFDFDAMRIVLQ